MSSSAAHSHYQLIHSELKSIIDKSSIEIPILPEVAGKAVRLTQNQESEALQLAKLIQSDQILAGHVMRVANSAAYSPTASIQTLQQAIARLGMKMISEIALAASLSSELFDAPGYDDYIEHQISSSLSTAFWSKEVARACRKNVEAVFLSGLLHAVGRPVAVQSIVSCAQKMKLQLSREDTMLLEKEFHHDIGILVIKKWDMPAAIQDVVRYFECAEQTHPAQEQTMIVVAGNTIAQNFSNKDESSEKLSTEDLIKQPIFALLNLYPDDIQQILDREDTVTSAINAMTV